MKYRIIEQEGKIKVQGWVPSKRCNYATGDMKWETVQAIEQICKSPFAYFHRIEDRVFKDVEEARAWIEDKRPEVVAPPKVKEIEVIEF